MRRYLIAWAVLLTSWVTVLAADPKPLTVEQRLELSKAVQAATAAENQIHILYAELRRAEADHRAKVEALKAVLAKLRKNAGAAETCYIDNLDAWKCKEEKK